MQMLVSSLDHLSATAFYRTWGTFKPINKTNEINLKVFEMPKRIDWRVLQETDVVYFERPHKPEDLNNAIMFKRFGIKVWVDFDDNLYDIQPENPAYPYYPKGCHDIIKRVVELADKVTVSTDNLVKHYDKAEVVRNALPRQMLNNPLREKQDPYIVWRGGLSHEGDIYKYWNDIKSLTKDYQVLFLGATPNFIKYEAKKNQNIKIVPPMSLENYFVTLMGMYPKCFIVPLDDNEFNKGKSNIAALEALVTGAMAAAPAWDEWTRVRSCSHYVDHLAQSIMTIMKMDDKEHRSIVETARAVEVINYNKSITKRINILKELAEL